MPTGTILPRPTGKKHSNIDLGGMEENLCPAVLLLTKGLCYNQGMIRWKKIDIRAFVIPILVGIGLIYVFVQKPSPGLLGERNQENDDTPEKNITTLYNENGEAIIEACFLAEVLPEYEPISTFDWVPTEYYTKDHTIRFLLPQGYVLVIDGDNKYILTGNPLFERMRGSIYTTTEDFIGNKVYYTGYRNNYGITYSPNDGWGKQYLLSGRYTDYSTCDPSPYIEVNNRKVFVIQSGDAGTVGETLIVEIDKKIVEFNIVYVLGGDSGEGLDLPDNPEAVADHMRNIILTILGTIEVIAHGSTL